MSGRVPDRILAKRAGVSVEALRAKRKAKRNGPKPMDRTLRATEAALAEAYENTVSAMLAIQRMTPVQRRIARDILNAEGAAS